jgi:hypothetical protein
MLRQITPDAKLLSDLSEEKRTNTAIAKHTANDVGDLKFYKTSDGKRTFLRVVETIPPGKAIGEKDATGPATYKFSFYEVLPALGAEANPAPAILTVK